MFFEGAQALALRILVSSPAPDFRSRLNLAFHSTVGRDPKPADMEAIGRYFDQQRTQPPAGVFPAAASAGLDEREAVAWVAVSSILLNLDEFITRE